MTRENHLEGIAYWANKIVQRHEMYNAIKRHPDESDYDLMERKDVCWREYQSAIAMTRSSIWAMEKESGPVQLELRES